MINPSTKDQLIARFGWQPLAGATQVTDTQVVSAVAANERAAQRQAERERAEV